MVRLSHLPELVRFIIKWTAIGIGVGLSWLAVVYALNIANLATLTWHAQAPFIVIYILGMSFAVGGAMFTVGIAIWVRKDFGGTGGAKQETLRLQRFHAGENATLRPEDEDRPLP